jgi:hypothetical protein
VPNDFGGTLAGLDALAKRVEEATRQIVADVAHILQAQSMKNAPVGVTGNSTNAPGDLARSIDVEGPFGGDGVYTARVGPTVTTAYPGPGGRVYNYGRQREFGGEIRPTTGGLLVFSKFGSVYRTPSVFQRGSFYLTRARAMAGADIDAVIAIRLSEAVTGV